MKRRRATMLRLSRPILFFIALAGLLGALFPLIWALHNEAPPIQQLPFPLESYQDPEGAGLWAIFTSRVAQHPFNLVALILFVLAIVHTLFTSSFTHLGHYLERRRIVQVESEGGIYVKERDLLFRSEICLFLGEVEVVFALWAIALIGAVVGFYNWESAITYLNSLNYREPLFVIVIMTLSATRPILYLAHDMLNYVAKIFGGGPASWWVTLLTIGPLLGSFITEPGAMTITALLLSRKFYAWRPRPAFAYATLGLLFTNISVGGVLTQFAAPPVLMVADRWGWTGMFVLTTFGWKAVIGILVANLLYFLLFHREFKRLVKPIKVSSISHSIFGDEEEPLSIPKWITGVHIFFLAACVWSAHQPIIFLGLFLLFLGFYQATLPHQRPLRLRLPLLVGLFLAALIIHGGFQGWWIQPLLSAFEAIPLLIVTAILTTFNDNAAITYMSTFAPDFSESLRYAVMAGALTGGGLTFMANAPNPAGLQILGRHFVDGVSAWRLALGALIPAIIMGATFVLLR